MTTPSIDNVSDEVAKLLADIEKDKSKANQTRKANRQRVEQARPLLRQIWDELDANRPVKGCTTKQEWVEKFGKTTIRNCQYILAGGNKNRPDGKRNVSPTFLSRCADAKKKLADIQRQINAPFKDGETRDMKPLYNQIAPAIDGVYQEFLALVAPAGYEVVYTGKGWWMPEKDEQPAPKKTESKVAKQKGQEKKTHATGRDKDVAAGRTRCQKEISGVTMNEDAPTCGLCQRSIEQDERRVLGAEFDAAIAGVKMTKKENKAAWVDFLSARKHGYVRGEHEGVIVKDEAVAALVIANPLHFVRPAVTLVVTDNCPKDYIEEEVKNIFEEVL